jgi:outer membrane lipoprotein-sorting protein
MIKKGCTVSDASALAPALALVMVASVAAMSVAAASAAAQTPAAAPAAASPAAAAAPSKPVKRTKEEAMKILKTAEEIRSPEKAESNVSVKTVQDGKDSVYDMHILHSTERRAFVDFLAPKEERGRRMLARGRSYWSTFPDSKRVVAISRKEMIGNSVFAVADLFQIDPQADYDPEIVAEETENNVKLLKLNLKGKHDEVPYDRIEYWVEEDGWFPVRAKFYGVSGKHLKTLITENRKQIAGRLRPEVTRMIDEVVKGHVSWWETKDMTPREFPDTVFTKEYLQQGR